MSAQFPAKGALLSGHDRRGAAGKIKALYVVGENIASAGPHVADALGKLDFLVVQDLS